MRIHMQRVLKYAIPMNKDYFSLDLPEKAKILTVQEQHGKPQIWALVNPDNQTETRNFRLVGTGQPVKENADMLGYIGTFQHLGGGVIGHVFEIK